MGRPGHLVFEPLLGFQPFPFAMPGSQPSFPDSVRLSYGAAIVGFPLAGIGQLVAVPTGEDAAAVEDRHAPTTTTGGTEKPGPLPAKMAGGPVQIDGIERTEQGRGIGLSTARFQHQGQPSTSPENHSQIGPQCLQVACSV